MSFPRAKLLRFNDVTSCAPAPGSYDPKYEDKVYGTVIERSERFNEPKNKTSDPQIISVSGRSPSLNNLALFRTPINPRRSKKSAASQQQKENEAARNFDDKASIATSEVDALKSALIEKEQQVTKYKLQLELLVQQHAAEMKNIQEHVHRGLNLSNQKIPIQFEEDVDTFVCEQDELNQEIGEPTNTADNLQVSQLVDKSIPVDVPQQDTNVSSIGNNGSQPITHQMSTQLTVHRMGIEMTATFSAENISDTTHEIATVKECIDSFETNEASLIMQLNRNSEMIARLETELSEKTATMAELEVSHLDIALELLEAKSNTHQVNTLNQMLEDRVKRLDECITTSDRNVSHLKSRCVALEYKAIDRENCLMELVATLADFELKHQQEFKNWAVFESPEFTNHICSSAENLRSSHYEAQIVGNVKSFLTNVYKRRREIIRSLREAILQRDELRVLTFEGQLSIVTLHDQLDHSKKDLNSVKSFYLQEIENNIRKLEYAQLQCKKYKVGNSNLHSSLKAVSERLVKCHGDIEQLNGTIAKHSSENAALLEKIEEQCNALKAQNEDMIRLEARNMHDIELIHAELTSKVDVLKEEVLRQADDYQSALLRDARLFQVECDSIQSKLDDVSRMYTHVEKCNGSLRKEVTYLKAKLEESEKSFSKYVEANLPLYNLDSVRTRSTKLRNEVLSEFNKHVTEMDTIKDNSYVVERSEDELTVQTAVDDSSSMICCLMKLNVKQEHLGSTLENLIRWYYEVDLLSNFIINSTDSEVQETIETRVRKELFDLHVSLMQRKATRELRKEMEQELTVEMNRKDTEICRLNRCLCELETTNNLLLDQVNTLHQNVTETTQVVESWKKKYTVMEELVGPFRKQLQEFESERLALESKKEAADSEVKQLAQKYAEVLGHQNHKQKIKHVVQLKQHNLELKQTVNELENKLRQKSKAFEKLKEEFAALHVKEKKTVSRTNIAVPLGENSPVQHHHPRHIQED